MFYQLFFLLIFNMDDEKKMCHCFWLNFALVFQDLQHHTTSHPHNIRTTPAMNYISTFF